MPITLTDQETQRIKDKLLKFVLKVETRQARSTETYEDMKQILAFIEDKEKEDNGGRQLKDTPLK